MESGVFANLLRRTYLELDRNYTDKLKKKVFPADMIDPVEALGKKAGTAFISELNKLGKKQDDQSSATRFSERFDFRKNNRKVPQIRYGEEKIISAIKKIAKDQNAHQLNIASIGIGDGSLAAEYAKNLEKKRLIGMDIHEKYLKLAKKKVPGLAALPAFDLDSITQKNSFLIKSCSIDIAECTMVLHHVNEIDKVLSEIRRILKRKGYFLYLDLCDKTKTEKEMTFQSLHTHPDFHGMEYFREHKKIRSLVSKYFTIIEYERIGPGLVFIQARK